MSPLLAHQGGWDEFLLTAGLLLLMLWVSRRRRAREAPAPDPDAAGTQVRSRPHPLRCVYCDAGLEPAAERCPSCGFRVDRRVRR